MAIEKVTAAPRIMGVTHARAPGRAWFGHAPGAITASAKGVRVLDGPLCVAGSRPSDDLLQVSCNVRGLPDVTCQGLQQILDHGRREMPGGELPELPGRQFLEAHRPADGLPDRLG